MANTHIESHTLEGYHIIMSNLSNTKAVWGGSSLQYRECSALAAEYHRLLFIKDQVQEGKARVERSREGCGTSMELAFRTKETGQNG